MAIARPSEHTTAVTVFLVVCVALSLRGMIVGEWTGPPQNPDATEYDDLGWNLSQGRGYRMWRAGDDFRQPYLDAENVPELGQSLAETPQQTAKRPPLLPAIMAVNATLFGRTFWTLRLLSIACVAVAIAIVAVWVTRRVGWIGAASVVASSLVVDERLTKVSTTLLTEPYAIALATALAVCLVRLGESKSISMTVAAGLSLGLATLNRTVVVLWIPTIVLAIIWILRQELFREKIRHVTAFLVAIGIVIAPLCARNMLVAGVRFPLGTQGAMEAPAGFSDEAVDRGGVWFAEHAGYRAVENEPDIGRGWKWEQRRAEVGKQLATDWIATNMMKIPSLFVQKVASELTTYGRRELLILPLALVGLWTRRRDPVAFVTLAVIAAELVAVGATWSVAGRFFWPTLPLIHALAVLAVFDLFRLVVKRPDAASS